MRGKRLTVKILVTLTVILWAGGFLYCVWYRLRHPVNSYHAPNTQQQNAQKQVPLIEQPKANVYREPAKDHQEYAEKWFEPITILTAFLVIGVAVTAYIYWRQLKEMQKTVAAVAGQGDTMKDQLTAMKAQEGAMKGQLEVTRETLVETRRVFDLTERPIIIVEKATINALISNRPLIPVITIANRGRTAAKRLTITIRVFAKMNWDLTKEIPDSIPSPAHIHFLAAGGTIEINGHGDDAILLDGDLYRGIVAGNQFCVIYVSGTYRNLSGDREYPIDEYVFSYYAGVNGFAPHHYHMASIEKRKEQSTTAGKKQENPN